MAKIITDKEIGRLVTEVIRNRKRHVLNDTRYKAFLVGLADALTGACGGEVGCVAFEPGDTLGFTVGFHVDDRVPADGGVYAKYDTDVTWKDGEEL